MKLSKKIVSLTLIGLMLMSTAVSAEPIPTGDTESSGGDATVVLYSNVSSSYSVQLPKSVDVTNETTTFTIKAKGEIAGNQKIMVSIPESATLVETDENGTDLGAGAHDDIALTLFFDKAASGFAYSDINPDDYNGAGATGTVTVTHTGVANNLAISISLQ